jgi:hypothetical protein
VPPLDLLVEVLEEADLRVPAGVLAGAVAGDLDEVEVVEDRRRARQVDSEDDAGLERADEQRLEVGVVARDLGAELRDARRDLVGVEVDLADAVVAEQRLPPRDAASSPARGHTAAPAARGRACIRA